MILELILALVLWATPGRADYHDNTWTIDGQVFACALAEDSPAFPCTSSDSSQAHASTTRSSDS